jgi:hypothetical protein
MGNLPGLIGGGVYTGAGLSRSLYETVCFKRQLMPLILSCVASLSTHHIMLNHNITATLTSSRRLRQHLLLRIPRIGRIPLASSPSSAHRTLLLCSSSCKSGTRDARDRRERPCTLLIRRTHRRKRDTLPPRARAGVRPGGEGLWLADAADIAAARGAVARAAFPAVGDEQLQGREGADDDSFT